MQLSAFDQLEVSVDADDHEIKASYLALVHDNPPDKNPQRFAQIREAYELIATQEARLSYILFQAPVLGLHDVVCALMKPTQTPAQMPSAETLLSLIKEQLHAQ